MGIGWRGRRTFRNMVRVAPSLVLLLAASTLVSPEEPPRRLGVVERAGITLVLLDVEARDRDGRPLRHLSPGDFRLTLDGRSWPIVGVDDLCPCEATPAVAATPGQEGKLPDGASTDHAESSETNRPGRESPHTSEAALAGGPPAPAADAAAAGSAAAPPLYVIYLDFSQLQLAGRRRALQAVESWLHTTRQPGDETAIAAYSTATGLLELAPPTRDAARLLQAVKAVMADEKLLDPFPELFVNRIDECHRCLDPCEKSEDHWCRKSECIRCCPCLSNAQAEYEHQRHSLKALKLFLTRLESLPGRKIVLFFHENGLLEPGSFYSLEDPNNEVGTLIRTLEEVGAEATTSRAAIYPVQMGDGQLFTGLSKAAVNFGANLADFTGGAYNRGPTDVMETIARAGRGCSCTYRIAFEPPETRRTRIYEARVKVAGSRVPYAYRVQFLTEDDRLTRKARSLLSGGPSDDLPIVAMLAPVSASGKHWNVEVRIAIDLDAMPLLSTGGLESEQIDLGALLHRTDGSRSWEMLTGSTIRRAVGTRDGSLLLYERVLPGVEPGRYSLSAFVREQLLELSGTSRTELELPALDQPALIGPLAFRRRRVHASLLPLRGEPAALSAGAARARAGSAPADISRVQRGEHLEASTWICSGSGPATDASRVVRFLARDGVPAFRLPEPRIGPAGRCARLTDIIDTGDLAAGAYEYRVEWKYEPAPIPLTGHMDFTIVETPDSSR